MTRCLTAAALLAWLIAAAPAAAGPVEIQVYKSPTCGCCTKWIDHLRENGFSVKATDMPDVAPVKQAHGVPFQLAACHTALVDGYVLEGHVPADDVKRLLAERPEVTGLAVPGMPIGSPGMEGPNPERYRVISFGADGVDTFAEHGP